MSHKGKKGKPEGAGDFKEAGEEVNKPTGRVPTASVSARHGINMIVRRAKGFSLGEAKSAGLSLHLALRWGLPLDIRRRSVLDANVESVKGWTAHSKPMKKEKEGELKKLEEEVVKVEKEVKKEAAKAKAEVKKAEEKVVGGLEKPKSRARKKKPAKAE